jgi:hypothetical protein
VTGKERLKNVSLLLLAKIHYNGPDGRFHSEARKGGAEVFFFLLLQKWNGYRFFRGIMFVRVKRDSERLTEKSTTGEPSCVIFLYLRVFCFLLVQKWNGYVWILFVESCSSFATNFERLSETF